LLSYVDSSIISLQPFLKIVVDVLATAAAFFGTTVCQVSLLDQESDVIRKEYILFLCCSFLAYRITVNKDVCVEQDKSMNRDEGSYQLPHIYDYLLFTAATPGRQSF